MNFETAGLVSIKLAVILRGMAGDNFPVFSNSRVCSFMIEIPIYRDSGFIHNTVNVSGHI